MDPPWTAYGDRAVMVKIGSRLIYMDGQSAKTAETPIEIRNPRTVDSPLIRAGYVGTCHLGFGQFHGEGAAGNDSKSNWGIHPGFGNGEPGIRGPEEFDHWCEEARGTHGPQRWRGLPEHDVRMVEHGQEEARLGIER
jgi:hypothetical protein